MVDFRINEIRQTGAVENRTYRGGVNVVRKTKLSAPINRDSEQLERGDWACRLL